MPKGSRSVFWARCFSGGLGYQGQTTTPLNLTSGQRRNVGLSVRFCLVVDGFQVVSGPPGRLLETAHLIRGIPKLFWGPSGFVEAWGAKANKPHNFKKSVIFWPCRLRRQGQKTIIFLKMCGCLASVPQASQKTLGQPNTSGSL